MNEETQVSSVETSGGEWPIDTSDIYTAENEVSDNDETPLEESVENTDPETDDADPQTQPKDEADAVKTETEETKQADQFTLKHLDEVKIVSREDIIPLAQKGLDYDRVRTKYDEITSRFGNAEQLAKNKEQLDVLSEIIKNGGYKDLDEFIDTTQVKSLADREGITEAEAQRRINLDKREKELKEKEAKLLEERNLKSSEEETAKKAEEKRQGDIKAFIEEYPGIKPTEIPKEVWDKVNSGDSLVSAYRAFENRELKKKLEAEKKNAENKQRTTGSRTTAGQEMSGRDKFLEGWNS